MTTRILAPIAALSLLPTLAGADWPSWLGPHGDAVLTEPGILEGNRFPSDEPEVLWRTATGLGYSAPAVAEGKVFLADYVKDDGEIANNPGSRVRLLGHERVRALDLASGEPLWTYEYARPYSISYPSGPRAMPVYDAGNVFFLGAEGDLTCLDAATGEKRWSKDFAEDFGAETPIWGHSATPLVDGDLVYCVVGGKDAHTVAFDKSSGEERWRALSAPEPGYCPPVIIEPAEGHGDRQLVIWTPQELAGLSPATGEVYWTLPLVPKYGMAIAAPRIDAARTRLFVSGIGPVAAMIQLGDNNSASIAWRGTTKTAAYTSNSTPIIEEGIVYACDITSSDLVAFALEDGEHYWATTTPTLGENPPSGARHGTAFLTKHEPSGHFLLFRETGDLLLADLDQNGYTQLDSLHLLQPTNEAFGRPVVWTAPAFADGSVIVRNDVEIVRVSLRDR